MKPYLIQRAKFVNNSNGKGMDSILNFDYMGSAEFEFGALPQSLARIRKCMADYVQFQYNCTGDIKDSLKVLKNNSDTSKNKIVIIFCKKEKKEEVCKIIEGLSDDKFILKEYCDLFNWVHNKERKYNNDFWWDIENDFMFWKFNPEFNTKFEKLIKPITEMDNGN